MQDWKSLGEEDEDDGDDASLAHGNVLKTNTTCGSNIPSEDELKETFILNYLPVRVFVLVIYVF